MFLGVQTDRNQNGLVRTGSKPKGQGPGLEVDATLSSQDYFWSEGTDTNKNSIYF